MALAFSTSFIYWAVPILGTSIFTVVFFSWIDPLIIVWCPSFSLKTLCMYFKIYFVWYEYWHCSFLLISVYMKYPFQCPDFQSVSLDLKWVFCRQLMFASIQPVCLLERALNHFTFKVIIDIFLFYCLFFFGLAAWLTDLSSLTRDRIQAVAVKAPNPTHSTARKLPCHCQFINF